MKTVQPIIYVIFLLLIVSCGVPQAEYDKLQEENEKLKKEITECELTPAQMLELANESYETKDYTKSRSRLQVLIAKYANSDEGKKGKKLLKKVENQILETSRVTHKEKDIEENIEEHKDENVEKNKKALSKMKKKYDENDKVTWYSDQSASKLSTKNYIQAYIGKKEKKPWLAISINYFSKKKWLHTERIEVTADKNTFEIEEDKSGEFKSKEETNGKREWLDRVIMKKDMPMIKAIASSKITKIKFVGADDVNTRTVTKAEKKSLQNVLDAYEALGGY